MKDDKSGSRNHPTNINYKALIEARKDLKREPFPGVVELQTELSSFKLNIPNTSFMKKSLMDYSLHQAITAASSASMNFRALTKGLSTTSELFKVSSSMKVLQKQFASQAMKFQLSPQLSEMIGASGSPLGTVTAASKALKEIMQVDWHVNTVGINGIASQASALSSLNELIKPVVSAQAMYANQLNAIQKIASTLPTQNALTQATMSDDPDIEDIDSDWFDTFPTEGDKSIHVKRFRHKVYRVAKTKTAQPTTDSSEQLNSDPRSKTVNHNDLISLITRINNLPIVKIIEIASLIGFVMTTFGLDQAFINESCRNIVFVLSMVYYGEQQNK